MLKIEILPNYPFPVFKLTGNLDALGVQPFENEVMPEIQKAAFTILEMTALNFLSSAGIRKLITLEKELRNKGGFLYLSSISEPVKQVLEISGLLSQFHIAGTLAEAVSLVNKTAKDEHHHKTYSFADRNYIFSRQQKSFSEIFGCNTLAKDAQSLSHFSVNELGYGMGTGCFSEVREGSDKLSGPFFSLPGFFAFKPQGQNQLTDYLNTGSDGVHGVFIKNYLGTTSHPDCMVEIPSNDGIKSNIVIDDLLTIATDVIRQEPQLIGVCGFVKTRNDSGEIQCYLVLSWIFVKKEIKNAGKMNAVKEFFSLMEESEELYKMRRAILLKGLENLPLQHQLTTCLENILNDDKIEFDLIPTGNWDITEGRFWLFFPQEYHSIEEKRMIIETEDQQPLPDAWDLIIRSVFAGSSKVVMQQLHGGYSAKTFMISSYDAAGRKRLPTVLKLGGTNIIGREERRYREFVQPFILNNSVSVLGATYYGNTGGICYNFLGVGGPESKLRWLTHIYRENDAQTLGPLFDRIFKGILKPWYGQPKWDHLCLYRDHTPLFPFFPNIFEDAKKTIGIDADEQYLDCKYLGRKVLNPYWYLKYEWPKHENESMLYYSSVCHGDLNMQNILVDENENIYIIDFSETTVRNAVSDFARLEPIFKLEMTRMNDEDDLAQKLKFEEAFVKMDVLGQRPEFVYDGDDPAVIKAYEMSCKMREYARQVTVFEDDPLPYWLAVLEWTLPVVSYGNANPLVQKHAAFSAGLICERIFK